MTTEMQIFLKTALAQERRAAYYSSELTPEDKKATLDALNACERITSLEDLVILRHIALSKYGLNQFGTLPETKYNLTYSKTIEWVCDLVSSILIANEKPPLLSHLPTIKGLMRAVDIYVSY